MFAPLLTEDMTGRSDRSSLRKMRHIHNLKATSRLIEAMNTGMQQANATTAAILVLRFQLTFWPHQPPAGDQTYLG